MGVGAEQYRRIGDEFVARGLLDEERLAALLSEQQTTPHIRLGSLAVARGALDRVALLKVLSERHGVPGIDLSQVVIPLQHLRLLRWELAREHGLLPIFIKEDQLVVVMSDPSRGSKLAEIEYISGRQVFSYVAGHSELLETIDATYAARQAGEAFYIGENAPDEYLRSIGLSRGQSRGGGIATPPPPSVGKTSAVVVEQPERLSTLPQRGLGSHEETSVEEQVRDTMLYPELEEEPVAADTAHHVLVVDDDVDIRRMMVTCLRDRGFRVSEAENGREGLDMARTDRPALIVLDAMMPGLHGLDVCRGLKKDPNTAHIPILMVSAVYTGWRAEADLKQSYEVDGYLEKPFALTVFLEKAEQLLEGRPSQEDVGRISMSAEAVDALHRGLALYREGKVEEALASLEGGLAYDEGCFQLHLQLGLLYGRQDRLFEAMHSLERAVSLNQSDFPAIRNLAILYQRAGFRHKAVEAWERALTLCSDEETRAGIKEHLVSLL